MESSVSTTWMLSRLPSIDEGKKFLIPVYSFSLATNFQPLNDYKANINAVEQPISLFVGQDDEVLVNMMGDWIPNIGL